MRSDEVLRYFAPIEYDRKEKSYYYSDPKYKLTESPINQSDKELLRNAIDMLSKFTEGAQVSGLQNILTKLESRLDREKPSDEAIIQFANAGDLPGQHWLYTIYLSIKSKKALNITYHPFGKKMSGRVISPQLLKEYNGRWYLLAFDHRVKETRVFALDRIKEIVESIARYHPLDTKEARLYFDRVVGVSVFQDKKVKKVRFKAFGNQVDYFKTKPVHHSQKLLSEDQNEGVFQIEVIINYELISELLSYQKNIVILAPGKLKKKISDLLEEMHQLYN